MSALGALCVTLATANGASGPAGSIHTPLLLDPNASVAALEPAPIDLSGLAPVAGATTPWPAETASSDGGPEGPDPLEIVKVGAAATIPDPRGAMITGMTADWGDDGFSDSQQSPGDAVHFGDRSVPRWIVDAILRGSDTTGVDPVYMMALADKESSFIPHNKAGTSSAEGLFQFITGTWLEVIRTFGAKYGFEAEADAIQMVGGQLTVDDARMREHILGLRRNAFLSALMAGEMKKRDTATIESKLGRKISRSEYYLAHFFGVDSARRFMSLVDDKPKQSAPRLFPAAAKANKALFFAKVGRKTRQLSIAEVSAKIDDMIDSRLARYGEVMGLTVAGVSL
ncbi:lytic transglycosylase domain-containing protein [Microvirga antarctica]|uniref:lytic transglycosylase domain-containing protein n=1 Tax=Microvirga antarctica TaxID=2819233 RepID=UPI001B31388C|nr:lytic transglycosylase domain-containing protein [Microvirga antarctica]